MAHVHLRGDDRLVFVSKGDDTHATAVADAHVEWSHCEYSITLGYLTISMDHDFDILEYLDGEDGVDVMLEREGKKHTFRDVQLTLDTSVEYKMVLQGTFSR